MSNSMLERIADQIERLSRLGDWVATIAVIGILALVTVEMVSRGLFGISTQISDEFCGYLNVAVIFFGLAWSLKNGAHVRVDLIHDRLQGAAKTAVRWIVVLTSLAYMAVATVVLIKYLIYSFQAGLVSTSYSETPLWIPQTIIVLGSILVVLQLAAFLLRGCRTVP